MYNWKAQVLADCASLLPIEVYVPTRHNYRTSTMQWSNQRFLDILPSLHTWNQKKKKIDGRRHQIQTINIVQDRFQAMTSWNLHIQLIKQQTSFVQFIQTKSWNLHIAIKLLYMIQRKQ